MQKMIEKTLRMADEVLMLSGSALEESGKSLRHAVREDDYIEIQNLMNKYASYHYYAEHGKTYEYFALDDPRTTAELGSTGVYKGRTKIYQMFQIYHDYNNQPGTAHLHPLNTPLVHVAGDGEILAYERIGGPSGARGAAASFNVVSGCLRYDVCENARGLEMAAFSYAG